jgi:hypothetical protein
MKYEYAYILAGEQFNFLNIRYETFECYSIRAMPVIFKRAERLAGSGKKVLSVRRKK